MAINSRQWHQNSMFGYFGTAFALQVLGWTWAH